MSRHNDIDPGDIDPDTGASYSNYSSPSVDEYCRDLELDDKDEFEDCPSGGNHVFVCQDDNEEIWYCSKCGEGES